VRFRTVADPGWPAKPPVPLSYHRASG
jgi:hypothetical protein